MSFLRFLAAAALALSDPCIHYCDMDTPLMFTDDPVEGGIRYQAGGRIRLPDGRGLDARLSDAHRGSGASLSVKG